VYAPYIKQEEPLKTECQHFLDCIRDGTKPLTDGGRGLELVRILEASSESLKRGGCPVELAAVSSNGDPLVQTISKRPSLAAVPPLVAATVEAEKASPAAAPRSRAKIQKDGIQKNGTKAHA
jgi:hypothetical protein